MQRAKAAAAAVAAAAIAAAIDANGNNKVGLLRHGLKSSLDNFWGFLIPKDVPNHPTLDLSPVLAPPTYLSLFSVSFAT